MTPTPKAKSSNVAKFLSFQIENSEKQQQEISSEAGFRHPNILSMIKTGATRLPLDRCVDLANSLGVDPKKLLMMAIQEYKPDLFEAIKNLINAELTLTANETKIIKELRTMSKNSDPALTSRNRDHLKSFATT